MSKRETLKSAVDTLQLASRLLRDPTPSPDMPVKLEILLQDAISEIQAVLGITVSPEPTTDPPDMETLEEWMWDGCCEATDGCVVEPDGRCPHGHPSWLLKMGLI